MNDLRKQFFRLDVFLISFLIPTIIVIYYLTAMKISPNISGLADNLTFILLFQFIYLLVELICPARSVLPVRSLWTLLVALFFVANIIYYRFFNTWIPLDVVLHWREMATIRGSIYDLARVTDILVGLTLPLVLVWRFRRGVFHPTRLMLWKLLFMILILLTIHSRIAAAYLSFSEENPLLDFPRAAMREFYDEQDVSDNLLDFQSQSNQFRLVNKTLYRPMNNYRYPLEEVPIVPRQATPTKPYPNVVFILVESFRAFESGFYGSVPTHTPNFDRLASQGMASRRFYANGSYTIKGEFSSLCSMLPDVHGSHVYIRFGRNGFDSLPLHLKKHGFTTHWISGLDANFGAARAFLLNHGIDQIHDSVPHPKKMVLLGPSDEDIYEYAEDILSRSPQPFFSEIMTLSSHFPFDAYGAGVVKTPISREEGRSYKNYVRGLEYADHALGEFLQRVSQTPWGRKTIFIVTGDHGLWIFPDDKRLDRIAKDEAYFRLPLVIWNPHLIKAGVIPFIGSQIDIAPTVLDLLGIYENNAFLGVSLLRNDVQERYAYLLQDERWCLRKGDEYIYDAGDEGFLEHFPFVKGLSATDPHVGFYSTSDLLHNPDPKIRTVLSPTEKSALENFGQNSLNAYAGLLYGNCVYRMNESQMDAP